MAKEYHCRVCGLFQEEPPWGPEGDSSTFDICPCCGVEFGYEDCQISAVKKYRGEWLMKKEKWFLEQEKPINWSLEEQLKNIPKQFK